MKKIQTPLKKNTITSLRAGEHVLLSGELFTARDQAHKKLVSLIKSRKKLPLDLSTAVIYYCGPTPPPPGTVIGACGPTTASRMDPFTPFLMTHGLRCMIGKGNRNTHVIQSIKKAKGIYFITYGGCGAYLHEKVLKRELIAFRTLGPEAMYKLTVIDFPLIVAIDSRGKTILK